MPSRYGDTPLPFTSAKPPPIRLPTLRSQSLRRGKTLTRPERHVVPAPLIAPPIADYDSDSRFSALPSNWNWWVIWSHATTFWAPPAVLKLFGIKEKQSRQAWREKVTLCWIALLLGAVVGFATMGLQRALCPSGESSSNFYERLGQDEREWRQLDCLLCYVGGVGADGRPVTLSVEGWVFNVSTSLTQAQVDFYQLSKQLPGQDITNLFIRDKADYPKCSSSARYASTPFCAASASEADKSTGKLQLCPLPKLSDSTFQQLSVSNSTLLEGYSWDQVAKLQNYMVLDGLVLNMGPYIDANPSPITGDEVDFAIRQVLFNQASSGKDITRLLYNRQAGQDAVECLASRYVAGRIDKITPGCFVASLFLYSSLVIILGVVLARFVMACVFNWFMSPKLVRPPTDLARTAISPAVLPEGANISVNNQTGTAPWASRKPQAPGKLNKPNSSSSLTLVGNSAPDPLISLARIGAELFTVCLVTCYCEGEDSVRGTVESIAATNYSDARKLIWIVCDGMITGQGEKMSTPDICVSMLDADPRFGNPMPMGYIAVGTGAKRENRAMVYAGHYGELA